MERLTFRNFLIKEKIQYPEFIDSDIHAPGKEQLFELADKYAEQEAKALFDFVNRRHGLKLNLEEVLADYKIWLSQQQ